jgi:MYXO-CTERM domain-containing protein
MPALALLALVAAYDQPYKLIDGGAWDIEQGPIPYVLEPNGVDDIDDGTDLDALRDAFRAWSCVEGTAVRFEEQPGPGPAVPDLGDGKNTLFWDETGEDGLGPGTLGVTLGDAGGGKRAAADIIFNGFDSSWSVDDGPSAVDVGSIALHEIGHFIGLDHPCDGDAPNETNCNGPERSVMTPVWGGGVERQPLPDDEDGVRFLYPGDNQSSCTGPFRKGEKCNCDGDCVDGLVCAATGADDKKVCTQTCDAGNVDCGGGFVCALSAPEGNEKAPGICAKLVAAAAPEGAQCAIDADCASGSCKLLKSQVQRVCSLHCDADKDCPGGETCFENFCLGAVGHEECPDPNAGQGCGCTSSQTSPAAPALAALAAVLVRLRRRRSGRA